MSHHAARTIRNFLATQLAESAEADVEEDEDSRRAPWEPVDTSWVALSEIKDILQRKVALQSDDDTTSKTGKKEAWTQQLQQTMKHIESMWAADDGPTNAAPPNLDKTGSVPATLRTTSDMTV